MNLTTVQTEVCRVLQENSYDNDLQRIAVDDDDISQFLHVLDCVVEESFLRSPKDLPYQRECLQRLAPAMITAMHEVAEWEIGVIYQARIHDCLWVQKREQSSARVALARYIEYILTGDMCHGKYSAFYRVIDLNARLNGRQADLQQISNAWNHMYNHAATSDRCRLLRIASDYQLVDAVALENFAEAALESLRSHRGTVEQIKNLALVYEKARVMQLGSSAGQRIHTDAKTLKIRRLVVDALVTEARTTKRSPIFCAHLLEQAILRLKGIPDTEDERKQLLQERAESQRAMMTQMAAHHFEYDMSAPISKLLHAMDQLNKEECFNFLARMFSLLDPEQEQKRLFSGSQASLASFFSSSIVDEYGRTIAVIPPLLPDATPETIDAHMMRNAILKLEVDGFCIANVLRCIAHRFEVGLGDIQRIVEQSAFVPSGRTRVFAKGLLAGFHGDLVTALSILVPQVENSIRLLLSESGVAVYNLKTNGTEEAKTFHGLMELSETQDIFTPDFIFTIRAVFCSQYGINVRNENAHGLLSDAFFTSTRAYYVWWFIFRCCYLLNGRECMKYQDAATMSLQQVAQSADEIGFEQQDVE